MNPSEHAPLKVDKPAVFEDQIERGFVERDAVFIIDGLLAMASEQEMYTTMRMLVTALADRYDFDMVTPGTFEFAASQDLMRFRELLISADGKSLMETRSALAEYKEKELAVRSGLARTPGL